MEMVVKFISESTHAISGLEDRMAVLKQQIGIHGLEDRILDNAATSATITSPTHLAEEGEKTTDKGLPHNVEGEEMAKDPQESDYPEGNEKNEDPHESDHPKGTAESPSPSEGEQGKVPPHASVNYAVDLSSGDEEEEEAEEDEDVDVEDK